MIKKYLDKIHEFLWVTCTETKYCKSFYMWMTFAYVFGSLHAAIECIGLSLAGSYLLLDIIDFIKGNKND